MLSPMKHKLKDVESYETKTEDVEYYETKYKLVSFLTQKKKKKENKQVSFPWEFRQQPHQKVIR